MRYSCPKKAWCRFFRYSTSKVSIPLFCPWFLLQPQASPSPRQKKKLNAIPVQYPCNLSSGMIERHFKEMPNSKLGWNKASKRKQSCSPGINPFVYFVPLSQKRIVCRRIDDYTPGRVATFQWNVTGFEEQSNSVGRAVGIKSPLFAGQFRAIIVPKMSTAGNTGFSLKTQKRIPCSSTYGKYSIYCDIL